MAEAACINVVDGAVVMCPCVNPDDVADTDTGTDTVVDNAEVPAAAPGIELAPVIKKNIPDSVWLSTNGKGQTIASYLDLGLWALYQCQY